MIDQQDDFEVCGAGEVEGAGTKARYAWTERGWLVAYGTDDGVVLGDSRHPAHPSLALLGLDDERRVVEIVAAWLELLDFGDEATALRFSGDMEKTP